MQAPKPFAQNISLRAQRHAQITPLDSTISAAARSTLTIVRGWR
jgi:hypothetical protein